MQVDSRSGEGMFEVERSAMFSLPGNDCWTAEVQHLDLNRLNLEDMSDLLEMLSTVLNVKSMSTVSAQCFISELRIS